MARTARILGSSGIYQIRLRGINDQRIFERDYDYVHFLKTLQRLTGHDKQPAFCHIYAYCLHENTVHLLLQEGTEPISNIMKRMVQSYSLYFNIRHERHGHLFVNRFDSEPIETTIAFERSYKYINKMPILGFYAKDPISYQWCSLHVLGNDQPKYPILLPVSEALDTLREFEKHPTTQTTIDFNPQEEVPAPKLNQEKKPRLTESYIEQRLYDITGCNTISDFQTINKATQRHALAVLKEEGASYNQLTLITGLPKGVIRYAKKDTREPINASDIEKSQNTPEPDNTQDTPGHPNR